MKPGFVRLSLLAGCLSVVLILGVSGCATTLPYERELLADPIMQFDTDPDETDIQQKLLGTREGSIGGFGGGGGGCGCN